MQQFESNDIPHVSLETSDRYILALVSCFSPVLLYIKSIQHSLILLSVQNKTASIHSLSVFTTVSDC